MTGIGKLLLAINAVLAISFMAFAAAVYSTHTSWRAKAETSQQEVTKLRGEVTSATSELTAAQAAAQASVDAAEDRAREFEGRLQGVSAERDAFEAKNNRLEQELLTQTGLADAKAREAIFRKEQAEQQAAVNLKLRGEVDAASVRLRDLEDDLFGSRLEYDQLLTKYEGASGEIGDLRRVLAANNLSSDVSALASSVDPPPPVDGLITAVRKGRTGNVEYVALSIGGDDGLSEGHTLSVVRPASRNQGRTKYLGEIEIVRVQNDTAVGRVIDKAKTGIIEVQDNVTSKL